MLKIFPVPEQMKQINKNDKEACNPNSAPKDHGYFLGQMVAAARKRINDKFSRSAKTKVAKMPKLHIAGDIAGMDKIEEKANLEWAQWSGFGFNPSSIREKFEKALQGIQTPDNHDEIPDVQDFS